jgi:hypothetical protein
VVPISLSDVRLHNKARRVVAVVFEVIMTFPSKYRDLREVTARDVEQPDYAWLTYAVCGVTEDACGWRGWILEALFKRTEERYPTGTGDKLLDADQSEACSRCGGVLFRTEVSMRFERSSDQTPVHGRPGIDYEVAPTGYDAETTEEGNHPADVSYVRGVDGENE